MAWSGTIFITLGFVVFLSQETTAYSEPYQYDDFITDPWDLVEDLLDEVVADAGKSLLELENLINDLKEERKPGHSWAEPLCNEVSTIQEEVLTEVSTIMESLHQNDLCAKLANSLELLIDSRSEILGRVQNVSDTMEEISAYLYEPSIPELPTPQRLVSSSKPDDCSQAKLQGLATGVTTIYTSGEEPHEVRCDQETEGGGWTAIIVRQRQVPQLNFDKDFDDYRAGFGSPTGEYWIGLDVLHELTKDEPYELIVTMGRSGERATSYYDSFSVGGGSNYVLAVSGYDSARSTGGDSLEYHNGMSFTTRGRDKDKASGGNCADWSGGGGWWFNYCYFSNPTGIYGGDRAVTEASDVYLEWRKWQGYHTFLEDFSMMIRPKGTA